MSWFAHELGRSVLATKLVPSLISTANALSGDDYHAN